MNNIYLIGMMGCGKSTCGRLLAEKLGRRLVDTDRLIVERAGKSVSDIFAAEGEETFRDLETQVCRAIGRERNLIVATGGGLPLRAENRALLRESGTVVFLHRDPAEIYDSADMSGRPLGQQGRAAFLGRFAERLPIYRACAHLEILDFSTVERTVAEILTKLEEMP